MSRVIDDTYKDVKYVLTTENVKEGDVFKIIPNELKISALSKYINGLLIGDKVAISIYDCCSGIATVQKIEENNMTIRFDEYSMCYPESHLLNRSMKVHVSDIAEIARL